MDNFWWTDERERDLFQNTTPKERAWLMREARVRDFKKQGLWFPVIAEIETKCLKKSEAEVPEHRRRELEPRVFDWHVREEQQTNFLGRCHSCIHFNIEGGLDVPACPLYPVDFPFTEPGGCPRYELDPTSDE